MDGISKISSGGHKGQSHWAANQRDEKKSANKMRSFLLSCVENRRRRRRKKQLVSLSPVFFYTSSFISTMEATHPTHHHHPPPRTGHMTHLPCLLFNSMQMSNLGHDNHALARPAAAPARSPHCLEHPSHSTARGAFHRLKPRVWNCLPFCEISPRNELSDLSRRVQKAMRALL